MIIRRYRLVLCRACKVLVKQGVYCNQCGAKL